MPFFRVNIEKDSTLTHVYEAPTIDEARARGHALSTKGLVTVLEDTFSVDVDADEVERCSCANADCEYCEEGWALK